MQRVEYVEIPGVRPKDYYLVLRQIYQHIKSKQPTFKEFRRWMRERGWWDKENAQLLMELMDIKPANPVTLGPFAEKLSRMVDETEGRELIGRRLIDQNPLIAKFCLEAMDVENEGRIQSTRELFKLIDSFVFPGKKPLLRHFNAWVAWAEAGNLIRLIGIRWGLTDFAKRVLPQLRALDVDEFLEEEEEEGEVSLFEEAEEVTVEPPVQEEEHPEPVIPREPEVVETEPPGDIERPAVIQRAVVPDFYVVRQSPVITRETLKDTARQIREWWKGYGGKRPFNFKGLVGEFKSPQERVIGAYLGLLIARGFDATQAGMMVAQLRSAGIFDEIARDRFGMKVLKKAYSFAYDHSAEAMAGLLGLVTIGSKGAREIDFSKFDTPKTLLEALNKSLYMGLGVLAPFVVARIAWESGELPEGLFSAAWIPFYKARLQAFRLGFLDRVYVSGFEDLVELSLHMYQYLPEDVDFEQPLLGLPSAFGCSFGCGATAQCPFVCREKSPYNE